VAAPAVTITASPNYFTQGGGTILSWTSTLAPCTYLDGSQGTAAVQVSPTGQAASNPTTLGTYLYTVTCGSGAQAIHATAQISVQGATTISASPTSAPVNTPVTLTWSSPGSVVCIPSGAPGSLEWVGTLIGSGNATVTSTTAGTVTYEISCNNGITAVAVNYTIPDTTSTTGPTNTVTPVAPSSPNTGSTSTGSASSSASKGGGGALDPLWLVLLATTLATRLLPVFAPHEPPGTGRR
jgi:hypothetical protein